MGKVVSNSSMLSPPSFTFQYGDQGRPHICPTFVQYIHLMQTCPMTRSVKCVYLLWFICAYFLKKESKPKVLVGRASMRFEPGGVGDSESDQHQGARRKTWQGRKISWGGIFHNLRGKCRENTRRKSIRGGNLLRWLLLIVFSFDST